MAFDDISTINSFSVSDFRNFERCFFNFLVTHHLRKRYELEEGSFNQTVGTILDLVIKKIHSAKVYNQPLDYLLNTIFKVVERELREEVKEKGTKSFYGATTRFLNALSLAKAKEVFKNYYLERKGKINQSIFYKRFWECALAGYKLWGGPDALEMGVDGVVEVVDYKYFEDSQKGRDNLDMDLMPKVYILLCAEELIGLRYKKARFRVRSWTDPLDESLYEEFNLENFANLKDYLKLKIEKILSMTELKFCEKPYCPACNSKFRKEWIKELQLKFNIS